MAQNLAQSIFYKIYSVTLTMKKVAKKYGLLFNFLKSAQSKQSPNGAKIRPIWSPWL
jgi:hypothetical protein